MADLEPGTEISTVDAPDAATGGNIVNRIDLPCGGWVELADPQMIRAKHRKNVVDRLNRERLESQTVGVGFDMLDSLMLLMVEKWNIPYFPGVARPIDQPSTVDELKIPDYDAIAERLEGARKVLFPDPISVDQANTAGSPTRPGGA